MSKSSSIIESLLFIAGEPVKIKKLARASGASESEARTALEELASVHEDRRGLRVLIKDDEVELVTHPDNAGIVSEYLKSGMEEDLTDATSETLAIVAYKGPIARAAIDDIRGVNSQYTLRTLLVRGLVERILHPEDARTYLYRISLDFLKKLGLKSAQDLHEFTPLSQAKLTPPEETNTKTEPDATKPEI
ncbi:MAG: SMC-Scp complex subunit ScpB [bacterium]|nr:SMC-Scp complex subunit ScpB [bacterium]